MIKLETSGHQGAMGPATHVLSSSPPGESAGVEADVRMRRVVDAHFDFVWRVLRRMGIPERDADDAAQQCFLVFVKRQSAVTEKEERSFLFQTALRIASNERRRTRRRREDGEAELPFLVDPDRPDELAEQRWARQRLDELLDTMPDDLRVAFVLFELEGFTLRDMGSILGIPQGTAASRVRRARDHYDRCIKQLQARLDGKSR